MHEHCHKHELKYCEICDTVYCTICNKEWKYNLWTVTYAPYYNGHYTYIQGGNNTNEYKVTVGDAPCHHTA